MPSNEEVVTLEIDDTGVAQGVSRSNAQLLSFEKTADRVAKSAGRSFEETGGIMVRTSDRTRNSVERLTAAFEKQSAVYGKSPIDRIIAQRDQLIQRLGNEAVAIDRVRLAAEKMIAAENQIASGGGGNAGMGGTGFRTTFAIKGVKDVFEGRGTYAVAEAVNELMALRGTALIIGGVTAGLAAAGLAAYEFAKGVREINEQAEVLRAKFGRFDDETKISNDELRVTNDRLEEAIAKLQHKPANGMKLAIDEAALAADKLNEKIDKSLQSFAKLVKENAPSHLMSIVGFFRGGVAGTSDVQKLIGGDTGFGGLIGDVYEATKQGTSPAGVLGGYRDRVQRLLATSEYAQAVQQGKASGLTNPGGPVEMTANQSGRIEVLKALLQEIDRLGESYGLEVANSVLEKQKGALESRGNDDRLREFEKRMTEREMNPVEKIFDERDQLVRSGYDRSRATNAALMGGAAELHKEEVRAAEREFEIATKAGGAATKNWEEVYRVTNKAAEEFSKDFAKAAKMAEQVAREIDNIDYGERRSEITSRGNQAMRLSELTYGKDHEDQAINSAYQERLGLAHQLYDLDVERASKELDTGKARIDQAKAEADLRRETFDAEMERELKLAEVQRKRFDSLKQDVVSLLDTLFNNPSQFGAKLANTIKAAILKPVEEGLAGIITKVVQPIIYGKDGKSGIAGALGGIFGKHGIQDVQLVNGTVPVTIMNFPGTPGAPSGNSGPYSSAAGTFARILGAGAGIASMATARTVGGEVLGGGDSTAGLTHLASGLWSRGPAGPSSLADLYGDVFNQGSPGGTPGFAGPIGQGPGAAASAGGGILSKLGLSGTSAMNLAGAGLTSLGLGLFSNGIQKKSAASTIGGGASLGAGIGLMGGPIGAVGGAGIGLIANGWQRGGWGGTFEMAGGGAALGFNIAGPLGAGIGAAAGFLAGLGKQIFGGDDDATHASKLIKQMYGIDIPKNSGAIKQILAMAKQDFGGAISMAVQSPAARQLIMLYSQSTGQKSNLFLQNPQMAGLVETNGKLNQGLVYNDGIGYSYSSQMGLPTLGNSGGTIGTSNPYGASAQPAVIQLNPQQTVDLWKTGTTQAITGSPRAVAAAGVAGSAASSSRLSTAAQTLAPNVIFG